MSGVLRQEKMIKKSLYVCNTVFQLYTAINMRMNIMDEADIVDIVITDRTDFSHIEKALIKEGLFDNIYLINANEYYDNHFYKSMKLRYLIRRSKIEYFFSKHIFSKIAGWNLESYDELYICNHDHFAEIIYGSLYKKNRFIKVFEFEEGYGTYVRPLRNERKLDNNVLSQIYRIFNIKLLLPVTLNASYLYAPKLYCWEDNIKKIELQKFDVENLKLIEMLNRIFLYEKDDSFNKKVIILEESFITDGFKNNDYELIINTIEIIGKENVMIKLHPRNRTNRFEDLGVEVFCKPVPWEVVCLNENFDDKILVTITSNTAFAPKILYNSKCQVLFLYKLLKGYNLIMDGSKAELFFQKVKKLYGKEIFMPDNLDEYNDMLKRLKL